MTQKKLTLEQLTLVNELVEIHGLDASQISFESNNPSPIFDYEAVCALSLKLTDIQNLDCQISERDFDAQIVSAVCEVTLPDGRKRVSEDSAQVGDPYGDGKTIDSMRLAELVAQSRAVRRGVRSVGINLANAHRNFVLNLAITKGTPDYDPRHPQYQEIHVLAAKIGLITGADKSQYQKFIAETFDGRISAKDLDDVELKRLQVTFRAMARLQPPVLKAA